jgi:endonuclease G, mitochondrial
MNFRLIASCLCLLSLGCFQQPAAPTMTPPSGPPLFGSNGSTPTQPTNPTQQTQMRLGNPDNATDQVTNAEHFLIARPQYALSYNNATRIPNWVSWHLQASDIGDTARGNFAPDPDLPADFQRVTPRDYTNSGYDRGHNCPSKDRSATKADNDAVFYMTNMAPQFHEMNGGPWEDLERYSRELVQKGNELEILCGHFGERARLQSGVMAPQFGWKIVVVVPRGEAISASSRVIAVQMPNEKSVEGQPWSSFITTPAAIEKATGLHFFDALSPEIAAALREKQDEIAEGSFGRGTSGIRKRGRR